MFKTAKDPAFWQRMIQKLPPWTDEVGAILLIVAGVVMLTALLNTTSEAALSITLSRGLRQLFGYGAYLVAVTVLGVGVWILLPKFGIVLRVGWTKIIAAETMFGALAALLHLLANDPELHALAREGKGGGFLGWVLMQMPYTLAGPTVAIVLFAAIFAAGLIIVTGLRLYHLTLGMGWLRARLQDSISRLDSMSFEPEPDADDAYDHYDHEENPDANRPNPGVAAAVAHATSEADFTHTTVTPKSPTQKTNTPAKRNPTPATGPQPAPPKRPSKARSKSNPRSSGTDTAANTPKPTTPPPANPDNPTPKNGQAKSAVAPDPNIEAVAAPPVSVDDAPAKPVSKPKLKPLTKEEKEALVAETRRNLGAPNGRSLVAPGEPGERSSVVPRDLLPDARVVPAAPRARVRRDKAELQERYFTVDDFRESKKIGKRDKNLPVLDLLNEVELNKPTEEEINTNAKIIKNTLLEFDVETEVVDVKVGPTVTQYAVSPYTEQLNDEGEWVLNRVRVSEITRLGGDLALALSAKRLRIQAPVPGHSYVGIEVPNRQPSTVALRPVLESEHYYKYRERPLALPLGRDVSGEPFIADLGSMPHLLIAGTTGSGKSIMLAAMTTAFVANNTPDQVKLVLLDPKMVELSRFNGLPHLLGPVETELDRIIGVLRWATREMDRRYKLLEKEAARNLAAYNRGLGKRRKDDHLPFIVIIIDEIGDLMLMRPDETERALTRLAQMARAVGIHLMVATQRPSVDVITGLIKANFPARISFAVASSVDSRVILDSVGAETLMGRGDMLFLAPDAAGPQRVQGCYVSDEEVNAVVNYWRDWYDIEIEEGRLEEVRIGPWERGMTRREVLSETDPMLEEAITLVVAEGEASASLLQRRLGLGYPRAARLMDLLQELGIVGTSKAGGRSREVLVKPGADPFKKIIDKKIKNKK
ncbi:MAG: DNA translocase FtsK [Anaerolineae bacterium]|nr:DNA translocase FtsK [Anaerolineae bacterium]